MYMMISIYKGWIVTSLYEKSMNLYLYILSHSVHPPGVLTGLFSGNINNIQLLWSDEDEINRRLKESYARLLIRGYQRALLIPVFTKGITVVRASIKRVSVCQCVSDQERDTRSRVFFHLTYHPRDPTSKSVQIQWRQHLLHPLWESPIWTLKIKHIITIDIKLMCVAYSRPKIIGNIFTYQKVDHFDGPLVSSYTE